MLEECQTERNDLLLQSQSANMSTRMGNENFFIFIFYLDGFKAMTVMYMRPIDTDLVQGNNCRTCFSLKINLLLF